MQTLHKLGPAAHPRLGWPVVCWRAARGGGVVDLGECKQMRVRERSQTAEACLLHLVDKPTPGAGSSLYPSRACSRLAAATLPSLSRLDCPLRPSFP